MGKMVRIGFGIAVCLCLGPMGLPIAGVIIGGSLTSSFWENCKKLDK